MVIYIYIYITTNTFLINFFYFNMPYSGFFQQLNCSFHLNLKMTSGWFQQDTPNGMVFVVFYSCWIISGFVVYWREWRVLVVVEVSWYYLMLLLCLVCFELCHFASDLFQLHLCFDFQ